jgi:ferredoxin--NADP+ reductase
VYKIIAKKSLAPNVKLMEFEAPLVAEKYKPGQFIILRIDEKGERIPLTVTHANSQKGSVTVIFQEIGKTTKQLGRLKEGEFIKNLIGPLGNPTEIKQYGVVVCIGGGAGIAPLYPEAEALKKVGNKIISIIGARTAELLILENEMRRVSDKLYITTDDGSRGHHGFVTDILKKLIEQKQLINMVIAIGPAIMMRAVANITKPFNIRTIVSLNPIMVDGTGMCGACRVSVAGKTMFTCVDGPEFDAHLVDFDELIARQRMYLPEEKQSLELYESKKHQCKGQ